MRKSYSIPKETVDEAKRLIKKGMSAYAVAKIYGVSHSTAKRWKNLKMDKAKAKRYYLKNRDRLLKQMREYGKRRRLSIKKLQKQKKKERNW